MESKELKRNEFFDFIYVSTPPSPSVCPYHIGESRLQFVVACSSYVFSAIPCALAVILLDVKA
jgi:hypothetical protein